MSQPFNCLCMATLWTTQVTHTPRYQCDNEHSCVGHYSVETPTLTCQQRRRGLDPETEVQTWHCCSLVSAKAGHPESLLPG